MIKFEIGQKFNVTYKSNKRFGEVAGECEIIDVDLKQEFEWELTSVKECYSAIAGTVTIILKTNKNNTKPKTVTVIASQNSEKWVKDFNSPKEYMWFVPNDKTYNCVSSYEQIN